jgi:hypothetical protein
MTMMEARAAGIILLATTFCAAAAARTDAILSANYTSGHAAAYYMERAGLYGWLMVGAAAVAAVLLATVARSLRVS